MMRDASSAEMECKCGCKEHDIFLKAKGKLMIGKEEEALDLFGHCIRYCKHSLALEEYISVLTLKSSMHTKLIRSLARDIDLGLDLRTAETTCRKFKQYDMEKVIELLGNVFEKSGNEDVLYLKARILLVRSQNGESVDERCIEAFESYLLLQNARSNNSAFSHFYLALCYFQKHNFSGHESDEVIGVQYCLRLPKEPFRNILSPTSIAFLLGKGCVSSREFGRIDVPEPYLTDWFERGFNMERILKHIFLWSSKVGYRISRNPKAACDIYEDVLSHHVKGYHSLEKFSFPVAANRLALICHKGTDGIGQNLKRAEELYTNAIKYAEKNAEGKKEKQRHVHCINAMSNLAVLYGQRENDVESATRSRELFEDAIEQLEKLEGEEENEAEEGLDSIRSGKHSTSMNNLAVVMEADNDIAGAKKLYRRSVAIDENPVAMYNLAVLLKFEDRSGKNSKEAKKLFCDVSDLGVDLQSTPVLWAELENAQSVAVSEISRAFPFKVEEVDDCLAYVKVVDTSR